MPPEHSDDGEIINFRVLRNWWVYGARSASRHRFMVLGIALIVTALAALVVAVMPRTYHVESKLLAQSNANLQLRGDQPGADPTKTAADTVLSQDSLVDLIKETQLLEEWPKRRAPILRVKDWLFSHLFKAPTRSEQIENMVGYLRVRLTAYSNEGTVTLKIDWPDKQMAYRLVDVAERNFLEARHVQEVSTIAEATAILEGHASDLRREIDTALGEIQVLRERKKNEKDKEVASRNEAQQAAQPAAPVAPVPAMPAPDPGAAEAERKLSELQVVLDAKQRTIKELEEFRQRRQAELHAQLEEKRGTYTEAHPVIQDIKQAIIGVSQESPQVSRLRADVKDLQTQIEGLRTQVTASGGRPRVFMPGIPTPPPGRTGLPNEIRIEQEPSEERDPEIEYARSKLRFAITNYQQLQEKIQASRVELDTAEAAFKHRYTVIMPPELPRGPIKPKPALIILGALLGGLLLGLVAAVGSDLRRGTLYEGWQVEQVLALPVLSEVRRSLPSPEKRA